jgi:cell division cycle protein 37
MSTRNLSFGQSITPFPTLTLLTISPHSWKQRDIHEKREVRKQHIQALTAEISCNKVLQPRLQSISAAISTNPTPLTYLSNLVEQLQTNPSPDAPPTNAPGQPTYDAMVLSLLLQVSEAAKKEAKGKGEVVVGEKVKEGLERHLVQLGEHTEQLGKDLEAELKEQKKHITSEDMHDGFDSKVDVPEAIHDPLSLMGYYRQYVPAPPEPAPIKHAKLDAKPKTKTTEFEVLNPKASTSAAPAASGNDDDDDEDEDSLDTELPELTPSLEAFSRLPLWAYETSWKFIQSHRDVVVPGASDALLVAAFRAQGNGNEAYAKQCVHQSLLLQYCDKLGGDGVRVFFQK